MDLPRIELGSHPCHGQSLPLAYRPLNNKYENGLKRLLFRAFLLYLSNNIISRIFERFINPWLLGLGWQVLRRQKNKKKGKKQKK